MRGPRFALGVYLTVLAAVLILEETVTSPGAQLRPPAVAPETAKAVELELPPPPSSAPPVVVEASLPTTASPPRADAVEDLSAPQVAKLVSTGEGHPDPSPALLASLRQCEATGSYSAVSRSGVYRGGYQFDLRTWNDLASRKLPWLLGLDPAAAAPADQDAMASTLWRERGAQPWPICGYRALALHPEG